MDVLYGGVAAGILLAVVYGVLTLVDTLGDRLYGRTRKRQR
jgi:hypothetical protein